MVGGFRLPVSYKTSASDSLESLEWMDGVADIYMPDFKLWSAGASKTYLKAEDYPEYARAAIGEMHRQVGPLTLDADGLATRGLIIRHLVIPGMLEETPSILEWIAREPGPNAYVNLMDQYYPAGNVSTSHYGEINRRLDGSEFARAKTPARELGLTRPAERRPSPKLRARRWTNRWGNPKPADSLPPTHYGPSSGRPAKLQALKPPIRL